MNILSVFVELVEELQDLFPQKRSAARAAKLMIGNLLCMGRHWITRILCAINQDQQDWSADYKLFSRSKWLSNCLFEPIIRRSIAYYDTDSPIVIAGDETKIKRAGRRVKRSSWMKDPMSPPFHVNFVKGIRFVQFSVVLPLHRITKVAARAVPISFEPVSIPAKPSKIASEEKKREYKIAKKKNNMCQQALRQMALLRKQYDAVECCKRKLLFVLDGGFCNRTILRGLPERCEVLARCRKDASLCFKEQSKNSRRFYSPIKFTPHSVYADQSISWQETKVFYGGSHRIVRYKEITGVLWQRGAGRKTLRLIVIAPTAYRLSPNDKMSYRSPAFLLTTDCSSDIPFLIQSYIDRWEIEVNHRDEKQLIGIEHPQVWNEQSVDKVPAFQVASYSYLLLSALIACGPERTAEYFQPPLWQRQRRRPSILDLLAKFRDEACNSPQQLNKFDINFKPQLAVQKLAA